MGVRILTNPWLHALVLAFSLLNKRAVSIHLYAAGGKVLTVVCAYAPNIRSDCPVLLEFLNGVLEGVPLGESLVLLGNFNTNVDNNRVICKGVINSLHELNPNSVRLFDFFAKHGLSIRNTMFEYRVFRECT